MQALSHPPIIISFMIVAYLLLVGSISWVAWKRRDDGIRGLALALSSFTLAYILFTLREFLAKDLLLSVYYCLIGQAYVFLQYGVLKNFQRKIHWPLHETPVLLLILCNIWLNTDHAPQAIACFLIYTVQFSIIAVTILRQKRRAPSCGSNMVFAGMLMSAVIELWWVWHIHTDPTFIYHSAHPESFQTRMDMLSFILSILVSNGFILMAKERVEAELKLNRHTDELTGLTSAMWLEEAAGKALARLQQLALPVTLMLIDINDFHDINARHGSTGSDQILQELRKLLLQHSPPTSEIFRSEGGKFSVLMAGLNIYQIVEYADALRTTIADHVFTNTCQVTVTTGISIGTTADSWGQWYARASHALQKAKAYGHSQIQIEEIDFSEENLPNNIERIGKLRWNPGYDSGDGKIDHQHQELFDLTNTLLQIWTRTNDRAQICKYVANLIDHGQMHFNYENDVMRRHIAEFGTEISAHISRHETLMERATDLFDRYQRYDINKDALLNFLIFEFVSVHIRNDDVKITELMRIKTE